MLRITTFRITGTPPPDITPGAGVQAFNDMCAALEKLPGAGRVRWYFGNNGIVTVGEPENYGVADTILRTPAAQATVGRVLALGYAIVEDSFMLEAAQVLPFVQQVQPVPAALSRN